MNDDPNALEWARTLFQDVLHAWFEGEELVVERGLTMRIIRKDGKHYVEQLGRSYELRGGGTQGGTSGGAKEEEKPSSKEAEFLPNNQKQGGGKKAPKGAWQLLP